MRIIALISVLLASCASDYRRIDNYVNNAIKYKSDGTVDYWQTPDETLQLGTGDCEDYAILKHHLMNDDNINFVFVLLHNNEYHLMLELNGVYYDNRLRNRGKYVRDFELIETFKINDTLKHNNDKLQDMKTRHFDDNY